MVVACVLVTHIGGSCNKMNLMMAGPAKISISCPVKNIK